VGVRVAWGAVLGGVLALVCAGPAAAQGSLKPDLPRHYVTPDGQSVVFSTKKALTPDDQDASADVYVWSPSGVRLVSVGPSGGQAPVDATPVAISDDGSRVLFTTAEGLVPQDTDAEPDLYLRSGDTTTLISTGPADPGPGLGFRPWLARGSADLSRIYFVTDGPLVAADTDQQTDIYEWRADTGQTTLVTGPPAAGPDGYHALEDVSRDGSVIFEDSDEGEVAQDTNAAEDLYEHRDATTTLVSQSNAGAPAGRADYVMSTADGASAVFRTDTDIDPNDLDGGVDLYRRAGGHTTLVSASSRGLSLPCPDPGTNRIPPCYPEALAESADGGHILFGTDEALVTKDANAAYDGYDRAGSSISLLTSSLTKSGSGFAPAISADGSRTIVVTSAPLSAQDSDSAVDLYALQGGTATLLTPGAGSEWIQVLATSRDARTVYFETADRLSSQDTNDTDDIYVDHGTGPQLVTTGPAAPADHPDTTLAYGVSDDGSRLVFSTMRPLLPADTNTGSDTYMWSAGRLTLLS
jgi:Tol biopolymer transport system component